MATLRLPSWFPHWGETTTKDNQELSDSARARDFVREAYDKRGGATPDLKRVYGSYLENERRRKSVSRAG
jgi:hypothetical protein